MVEQTAGTAERAGWYGILVPHNLHDADPWMVACYLGSLTERLVPLLAVQPACVPPHTAAAFAAAYAVLYDRPVDFNLVAGARDDEMRKIGDSLSHDARYERLRRYARILRALLSGETVDGSDDYYAYRRFRLEPRPEILAQCKIFVAGSSEAGLRTAAEIADVVVTHPLPYPEWCEKFLVPLRETEFSAKLGIRIGIICRPDAAEAWAVAARRFPQSWVGGQKTLLVTRSSNVWARELAQRAVGDPPDEEGGEKFPDPYWLGAYRSGRASAPFLVGTYESVASRLREYLQAGVSHVLLHPVNDGDREHVNTALRLSVA
jgi:alkanesulfonate monooxygenase